MDTEYDKAANALDAVGGPGASLTTADLIAYAQARATLAVAEQLNAIRLTD